MRVLICCECSGVVRRAFRARGHDAWSNDLKAPEDGSPHHILDDAFAALRDFKPDLLIAHPVCRFLANSGAKHLYRGMKKENGPDPERWENMRLGVHFFKTLWNMHDGPKCFENPIMHGPARELLGMRPTQIVQPWMFGHAESKATGLYLDGLPKLVPTNDVYAAMMALPINQRHRVHYAVPGPNREADRSRSYPGIWEAAAEQWTTEYYGLPLFEALTP
jgi:hypothetical protein